MKHKYQIYCWCGLVTICLGLAPGLWGQSSLSSRNGCGYYESTAAAKLKPAAFVEVAEEKAAIVGLWKIQLISKGNPDIPDGTVLDNAYATWHADGTEIMNSSRPPISGNFCMGVWKQTKRNTFKLNHIAMGWDPSGTTLIGPTNVREEVTVDRSGYNYTGTFVVTQYDTNGNPLGHALGEMVAHRITADGPSY